MGAEKIREIAERGGSGPEMWAFVRAHDDRRTWRMVHRKAIDRGDPDAAVFAEQRLAELPDISDLDALRVTTRLANHLMGFRVYVMRDAREAGASWADVAIAVGMAKDYDDPEQIAAAADAIRAWYAAEIDAKEQYVPDFHDVARSRAVIEDASPDSAEHKDDQQ